MCGCGVCVYVCDVYECGCGKWEVGSGKWVSGVVGGGRLSCGVVWCRW